MKLSSILVTVCSILLLLTYSCGSGSPSPEDKVDLLPVRTSKDGKWSMINSKGEVVYDSEFKNKPTAAYNGFFNVKEGKGYTVYKAGAKSPKAVNGLDGLKDVGYMEDGLIPVTFPGKRISIVDANGKTKFELNPIKGSEIIGCARGFSEERLWFINEDNKYGFVDACGNVVVQPVYEHVEPYSEGVATAFNSKDGNYADITTFIIDKNGKVVFQLMSEYDIWNVVFAYGYILAKKDDRYYLFDRKGNKKKLSGKINDVCDYNAKYIIYKNDDGDVGVMDFEGDIIVRPKYNEIRFGRGNSFIAMKDSDSNDLIKINSNGIEATDRIDYEGLYSFGKFGYFAVEGKTLVLLDNNFNKKSKEEFFEIFDIPPVRKDRTIYADYFDYKDAAKSLVKIINGNKVGDLTFGESARESLAGRSPSDYSCKDVIKIDKELMGCFWYDINLGDAYFSEAVADYYNYNDCYIWNPTAYLIGIKLSLVAISKWGKKGMDNLQEVLTSSGFTLIKKGKDMDEGKYMSLFKKGQITVAVSCKFEGREVELDVFNDPEGVWENQFKPLVHNMAGGKSTTFDDDDEIR